MGDRFETFLKGAIGLDPLSIGSSAVKRAVERRMRACHLLSPDLYWEHLNGDPAERQALIEAVIVPETWFYRDREAFVAAARILRDVWQARALSAPLRVLSVPCSTGEEPYTLAMALLDAQVPPTAIRIEAIDVSKVSLAWARAGVYGRNSFRGTNLEYRDRHFAATEDGYRISATVQSMVHFAQGNLFDLPIQTDGNYDVIFCRNLLIYFDSADQRRAADTLRKVLAPAGKLFVGHSEASVLLREGFTSLRIPQAFAFGNSPNTDTGPFRQPTPTGASSARPGALRRAPLKAATGTVLARQSPHGQVVANPVRRPIPSTSAPLRRSPALADIKAAADSGDLDHALELGRASLAGGLQSIEVFYLMAVVSEALGDFEAAAGYYRRTLYLAPEHHEALTHLTLMLRRTGDVDGARRMEDRARRLDERRGLT